MATAQHITNDKISQIAHLYRGTDYAKPAFSVEILECTNLILCPTQISRHSMIRQMSFLILEYSRHARSVSSFPLILGLCDVVSREANERLSKHGIAIFKPEFCFPVKLIAVHLDPREAEKFGFAEWTEVIESESNN